MASGPRRRLVALGPAPAAASAFVLVLAGCGRAENGAPPTSARNEARVVEELNSYWSEAADEHGFDYEPVPLERVSDGTDGATCDRREIEADDESLDENAFVQAQYASLDDPDAHGTPEERVAAFDLGVERGPVACFDDELFDVLPE